MASSIAKLSCLNHSKVHSSGYRKEFWHEQQKDSGYRRRRLYRQPRRTAAGCGGEDVITLDNLSTGFQQAVTAGELIIGDTGDAALLDNVFSSHDIDTVMHFAAHTVVPESVSDPLKYYRNNTAPAAGPCWRRPAGMAWQHIVFSSTAAVYGIPEGGRAAEDSPTQPINPYGTSKLMTEWMLQRPRIRRRAALCRPALLQCGRLRSRRQHRPVDAQSDAAGQSRLRGRHRQARQGVVFSAPTSRRPTAPACATTFMSRTWPRHISTRCAYLRNGGDSTVLNCGYGHGYSVREVLSAVEAANGAPLNISEEAASSRRPAGTDRGRRQSPRRARLDATV